MQLEIKESVVSIKGNITSIADFEDIKQSLETLKVQYQDLVLIIYDSLVINSSLIGYLVKLVNQDKIGIQLQAGSPILFELLDDLGLASTFRLKKI